MKNLTLVKPIVFIDLETTGLNPWSDRIVEISVLKLHPDGHEESITKLINPETHIPEETTQIHGIQDSDVADKPTFIQCAGPIRELIGDCDVAGFNIKRFDLPFLETEFRRASIEFSRKNRLIVDVQVIYHKFEQRDLRAAYRMYCGKDLDEKHRSDVDVRATIDILKAQLSTYSDLPQDICGLHEFCCTPGESGWVDSEGRFTAIDGEITFNFGKYKGKQLKEIAQEHPDYLDWILHNPEFSLQVQEIIIKVLNDLV